MKNVNKHLKIKIQDGQLIISIGISTLVYAIQNGDKWNGYGKITDEMGFAKDILSELDYEEEDGTNPVHRMLDDAAIRAAEQGSQFVGDFVEDEDDV